MYLLINAGGYGLIHHRFTTMRFDEPFENEASTIFVESGFIELTELITKSMNSRLLYIVKVAYAKYGVDYSDRLRVIIASTRRYIDSDIELLRVYGE